MLAFCDDAVAAVLFAGLSAGRHHHLTVGRLLSHRDVAQLAGGLGQRGKQGAAVGFSTVGVPGRSRKGDGAVRELTVSPAEPGVERFEQMVLPTG